MLTDLSIIITVYAIARLIQEPLTSILAQAKDRTNKTAIIAALVLVSLVAVPIIAMFGVSIISTAHEMTNELNSW